MSRSARSRVALRSQRIKKGEPPAGSVGQIAGFFDEQGVVFSSLRGGGSLGFCGLETQSTAVAVVSPHQMAGPPPKRAPRARAVNDSKLGNHRVEKRLRGEMKRRMRGLQQPTRGVN
jgi:hypothetical protein